MFFVGSGASNAQTPVQNVRIAYSSSGINYADLFLAKDKGHFREEGLDPQFIQMSSSSAIYLGHRRRSGRPGVGAERHLRYPAVVPLRVVAVTLRRPLFG